MADPTFSSPIVESDDEGEFQLINLEEGQDIPAEQAEEPEKPDEVVLTRSDYDKLLKSQDATATLTQGLQNLGDVLQRPQAPAPANVPQMPSFDPEEVETEAFKPKGFAPAVEKVIAARLSQMQAGVAQALQEENRRILKLDPTTKDTYLTYEKEIEARVASLPPEYRFNPKIYEQVHRQVMLEHLDEIADKRAAALVEQKVNEALEKAGIKAKEGEAPKKAAPAMYQEGAMRVAAPKPKKTVYLTAQDREIIRERGGDPENRAHVEGYLASKVRR